MEDERLKMEAKRNKALKSKAARQKAKEYREKLLLEVKQTGEDIQKLLTEKKTRQQNIELLESQLKQIELKLYGKENSGESDKHESSTSEFAPTEPYPGEWVRFPRDMTATEELGTGNIVFPAERSDYSSAIEQPAPISLSEDAHSWSSISDLPAQNYVDASQDIPSDLDLLSVDQNLYDGSLQELLFVESGIPSSSHEIYSRPSTSTSSSIDISFETSSAAEGSHLELPSQKKTTKKSKMKEKQYAYLQSPKEDPREEVKRRRAVKAYEHRQKKKDYITSLQTQISSVRQQNEELKQRKERIQQRIDSLQSRNNK